jgi:hypothetical protein
MAHVVTKEPYDGPRYILGAIVTFAILKFALVPTPALAQQPTDPAPAQSGQTSVTNAITQTAVSLGALTCAARVQQVTQFLGVNQETRVSIRRPVNPPDMNSFSVAMTVATDGTTGLALADFYPTQRGCKASYTITVNLDQSCEALGEAGFPEMNAASPLAENIQALNGPNNMRVFLVGFGAGCTVVKTETLD